MLISLSSGTSSIFFFFFFPILVASFGWGFAEGLRMGLSLILQKLASGADVKENLERLLRGIDTEIANLRHYMGGLKEGGESENGLLSAVRRFAGKFTEATGIAVHIRAETDLRVNDRLAAEVFQMVVEGLSNIRRHTSSAHRLPSASHTAMIISSCG